jgi:hypothetical protein
MADETKLIDLKYTKADKKEEASEMVGPSGQPADYPWGLSLSLESAELDKLGRNATTGTAEQAAASREWVGVALRMAGELYLIARDELIERGLING